VEDKTVKVTLIFGSTYITATATNKEGTEIRNCEFKFETSSGSGMPTSSPKKKVASMEEEEEK
jgi:hypothetical protein